MKGIPDRETKVRVVVDERVVTGECTTGLNYSGLYLAHHHHILAYYDQDGEHLTTHTTGHNPPYRIEYDSKGFSGHMCPRVILKRRL